MANQSPNNFPAATLPLKSGDIFAVNQIAPQDPNIAKQTTLGAIFPDTGWLDLSGFAFISSQAFRPQYRVIGRCIYFRGTVLVPLSNSNAAGGALVPYVNENSYAGSATVYPFSTGAADSVSINFQGALTFNNGNPVIPTTAHYPDTTYVSTNKIGARRVASSAGINTCILYNSTVSISISSTGVMGLDCLQDLEELGGAPIDGHSPLRFINTNVVTGDRAINFRDAGGGDTIHGKTAVAPLTYAFVEQAVTHTVTLDAALPQNLGGFGFSLEGLHGFLAPLV